MSSELDRILSNPEHIIMSNDLEESLDTRSGSTTSLLTLDGASYVCTLVSAKLLNSLVRRWEFLLEVPGIQFEDIMQIPEIQFEYDNVLFGDPQDLRIEMRNLEARYVILSLREIIKEDSEEKNHE